MEEAGQIAHGAAELIRESVAHLPDVDSSLYESALLLTRFAETIPALDESALHLAHFADTIPWLDRSAAQLTVFTEHSHDLRRFAETVEQLPDRLNLRELEQLATRLESVVYNMPEPATPRAFAPASTIGTAPSDARRSFSDEWLPVAKNVLAGLAVGLVLGAAGVGWLWWHHSGTAAAERQACTGPSRPANFTVTRDVEVKVSGSPSASPSPFVCPTWYPPPVPRPASR
ncbi:MULTISPECIES: hypothetical protein [unclassified Micromonospora]|uniref:hypothetical protein n=1 Tax=unclassified Micromonospora TaxID=2617518 RepID=UPI001C24C44A|nr:MULTISPECIES: hypothetical protein [unclassified Micromonospora]MBU8858060.1 hypothetical protein [Micromonospora sp. WMMB482]MDM4783696.1 hypothetical protein [Micromonospora sp. b486]